MTTLNSISDKVILVTGAAKGLGRFCVQHLVDSGAKAVFAFDKEFVQHFNKSNVFEVSGVLGNEQNFINVIDICRQRFGRLDILINCDCLIGETQHKSESLSLQQFSNIFELKTISTFNAIRLSLGLMADNKPTNGLRALIINTLIVPNSQQNCSDSHKNQTYLSESIAFSASAGAILSMTLPLARELGSQGIRCVAVEVRNNTNVDTNQSGIPQSYVHLIGKIIENPMINGTVIPINNFCHNFPNKL